MVPGSYVVVVQQRADLDPALEVAARRWNQIAATPITLRSHAEVAEWAEQAGDSLSREWSR